MNGTLDGLDGWTNCQRPIDIQPWDEYSSTMSVCTKVLNNLAQTIAIIHHVPQDRDICSRDATNLIYSFRTRPISNGEQLLRLSDIVHSIFFDCIYAKMNSLALLPASSLHNIYAQTRTDCLR